MNNETSHTDIIFHNDSIGEDYRFWSPSYNIHFGYWCWGVNPFDREAMLRQMNAKILHRLSLSKHETQAVVDAGCGSGATLRHLAKRLPKAQFKGISLPTWLLEKGRTLNKKNGFAGTIELIEADFQIMPFPDASIDALYCLESVCYAEGVDKAKLIKELYRVLKPGGRFVIVDAFKKHEKPLPKLFQKVFKKNADLWAVEELPVLPIFKQRLQTTGFENIKTEDISWRAIPTAFHIPFVVIRLLWSGAWRRNNYWKALLMTAFSGFLFPFMGYFMISGSRGMMSNE